jgi:hypothetical protein
MSSVVISGDTSGAITVSAPAVSGTNTLTLQAATATSAINQSNTAISNPTSPASANIDFTIPSWVKRITVMFSGVSLSASANMLIQLGVSGTPETSGYTSVGNVTTAAGVAQVTSTAGFIIYVGTASYLLNGAVRLHNITGNTWVADGVLCNTTTQNYTAFVAGSKALAGVANMVRITSTSTDTFDAGTINILYEG